MPLPTITGVGRLVEDPEFRFTGAGKALCKLRLAFSARKKDPNTGQWSDGDKCFLDATAWEQEAENIAESLTKGMEVLVTGQLRQREYEKDGQRRFAYDLVFATVSPTLKYATAAVTKTARDNGDGGRSANTAPASGRAGGFGNDDENPPF